MSKVSYGGQSYECGDKSVLECLTAQGVSIPSSCRSGVCQTCMMRVIEGEVPERAKTGLKSTLAAQNYFLACSCYPEQDITVELTKDGVATLNTRVADIEYLAHDILGIKLQPSQQFAYKAGQFINLYRDDTLSRSYSLASVPSIDDQLFLNVRKVPDGMMTSWIFSELKVGDNIKISEPAGECFYVAGQPDQNILLIATGSGLAPLYGIVRDALSNRHKGKLVLYHGSYSADGIYLTGELRKLAQRHENFSYVPCISDGEVPAGYAQGVVLDVAMADNPALTGWRVFLCGNPNMVNAAKQQVFFAGASMRDIFADPF